MATKAKKPHYELLKDSWAKKHKVSKEKVWEKHQSTLHWAQTKIHPHRIIAAGSLSSLLLFNTPAAYMSAPMHTSQNVYASSTKKTHPSVTTVVEPAHSTDNLVQLLSQILPSSVQPLNDEQTQTVTYTLSSYFNVPVTSQLNGISLNQNYGLIGEEQLLPLFPGDTLATHFTNQTDLDLYAGSGIAPGRGAWGYFAPSETSLTQNERDLETYYIAVPTFLAPGYTEHTQEYYDFFKYRKMLVINPDNGQAIVCDIADSGPSPFTGKQLGGSPKVMKYLGRVDGARKGPVLYYFINDPNNTIPLGPITIK